MNQRRTCRGSSASRTSFPSSGRPLPTGVVCVLGDGLCPLFRSDVSRCGIVVHDLRVGIGYMFADRILEGVPHVDGHPLDPRELLGHATSQCVPRSADTSATFRRTRTRRTATVAECSRTGRTQRELSWRCLIACHNLDPKCPVGNSQRMS